MSTSSSTRELSLRNILDELRGAGFSSANWRPLGMRLKPDLDLDAIEADFPRVDRRLEEVVKGWQRDGDDPSWETLAEAVSQCKDGDGGGKNVARNIRQSVGLDTIIEQLSDEQCSPASSPAPADSASEQRQQFRKRRSESFTELQELFAYLMSDLVEILGDEQVLPKMKTTLDYLPWRENPKFMNVLSESYKTANTVKEFFDALRPTCLDCELLAITVEATKCLEAIATLDRYLKVKDSKTIPTSGDDEKDKVESAVQTSTNGCASNFKIVEVCIQKESVNGRQYEEATGWLSYMWEIPRAALRFFRRKTGSVILEWQIEASLESHISSVPVTGLALKKLAAMGVTQIKVGDSYELEIPTELPPVAEESTFSSAALWSAMWARDDDMMERLINGGASPDAQDEGGFSLLMGACKIGRPYIVDVLLRNGATVDLRDKEGLSSLAVAAANGRAPVVEQMIKAGADPNSHDKDSWSALHAACSRQHTEVVRLLLSKGANPNSSTQDGWSAMMAACRKESQGAEVLNELLKAGGDPNAGNHESWTALMTAARNGRLNCVVKLLEYKADPDMQDNTGWSALMASVWNNHEDMAIRMLEAGAIPDIQDNNGTNALFLAIYRQLPRVIKAVLSYQPKPNVNLQDKVGETALMYACKMKDLESVKTLLDMEANPNTVSDGKETALLLTIQRKEVKITEVLLGAGADPDYRTENRISALMLSSKEGSIEITDLLLKHSAQPDLRDEKSGYTALMFGAEAGHLVVVKSLIRAEAQTALKNKDNTDAYYLAYQNKHVDVAKTIHQAHFSRHSTPPTNPSTLNKAKPSSEEVLEFLKILLDRLQRPPLLMEDAESKRRKFASTQQQTINIAPTEVAVGAA